MADEVKNTTQTGQPAVDPVPISGEQAPPEEAWLYQKPEEIPEDVPLEERVKRLEAALAEERQRRAEAEKREQEAQRFIGSQGNKIGQLRQALLNALYGKPVQGSAEGSAEPPEESTAPSEEPVEPPFGMQEFDPRDALLAALTDHTMREVIERECRQLEKLGIDVEPIVERITAMVESGTVLVPQQIEGALRAAIGDALLSGELDQALEKRFLERFKERESAKEAASAISAGGKPETPTVDLKKRSTAELLEDLGKMIIERRGE